VFSLFNSKKSLSSADSKTKARVMRYAEEMGFNARDIEVLLSEGEDDSYSFGSSIVLGKQHTDKKFIQCHELSHIRNSHLLKTDFLVLGMVTSSLIIDKYRPNLPVLKNPYLRMAAILLLPVYYARVQEKQADLEAAVHCNDFQIREFIDELRTAQEVYKAFRNDTSVPPRTQLWRKLQVSSQGDINLTPHIIPLATHPKHSTRIAYLERFMAIRNENSPLKMFCNHTPDGSYRTIRLDEDIQSDIHSTIKASAKSKAYQSLHKIVLKRDKDGSNFIMLYDYHSKIPRIFEYEASALDNIKDPRALIQAIVSGPPSLHTGVSLQNRDGSPLEFGALDTKTFYNVKKAAKQALTVQLDSDQISKAKFYCFQGDDYYRLEGSIALYTSSKITRGDILALEPSHNFCQKE